MPRINCPGCEAALRVDESKRGQAVRCPKCQHRFTVPPAEEVAEDDEEVELRVVERPKERPAYELKDKPAAPRRAPPPARREEEDEEESPPRARRRGPPPIPPPVPEDEEEDEERQRIQERPRRRRDEEDDDEDRPRARRPIRRDEEDDEDRPRPIRRRRKKRRRDSGLPDVLSQWNFDKILFVAVIGVGLLLVGLTLVFPPFVIGLFGMGFLMLSVGRIWAIVAAFGEDSTTGCLTIMFPWYGLLNLEDRRPIFLVGMGILYIVAGIAILTILNASGRF
jgi:predicted Zn finger-like uncharacterized protein